MFTRGEVPQALLGPSMSGLQEKKQVVGGAQNGSAPGEEVTPGTALPPVEPSPATLLSPGAPSM